MLNPFPILLTNKNLKNLRNPRSIYILFCIKSVVYFVPPFLIKKCQFPCFFNLKFQKSTIFWEAKIPETTLKIPVCNLKPPVYDFSHFLNIR